MVFYSIGRRSTLCSTSRIHLPPHPHPTTQTQIRFLESPEQQPPISELGWDPLLDMPSLEEFAAALGRQRRVIKGLLLDLVWVGGEWGGRMVVWWLVGCRGVEAPLRVASVEGRHSKGGVTNSMLAWHECRASVRALAIGWRTRCW